MTGSRDDFLATAASVAGLLRDPAVAAAWQRPSVLANMLLTRTMELAVHGDDLAASVGIATPELSPSAADAVIGLLARLATRRHGPTGIIRALTRAERAPTTIAAF